MSRLSWRAEALEAAKVIEDGAGVDRSIALADYISVLAARFADATGPADAWRILNKIADRLLVDAKGGSGIERPTLLQDIAEDVAARNGVTVEDLKSPGKSSHLVRARQEFMYLARSVRRRDGTARYSTITIGKFLNRDHSTIVYGAAAHVIRGGIIPTEKSHPVDNRCATQKPACECSRVSA